MKWHPNGRHEPIPDVVLRELGFIDEDDEQRFGMRFVPHSSVSDAKWGRTLRPRDEFDLTIALEVRADLFRLGGGYPWDRVENALWSRFQRKDATWQEHGMWWQRTTKGKRYAKEFRQKREQKLQSTIVSRQACVTCGAMFDVNESRARRKATRVCSAKCRRGGLGTVPLVEFDGEKMPLARWAERYGIPLKVIATRRCRGWDLRRALTTPIGTKSRTAP